MYYNLQLEYQAKPAHPARPVPIQVLAVFCSCKQLLMLKLTSKAYLEHCRDQQQYTEIKELVCISTQVKCVQCLGSTDCILLCDSDLQLYYAVAGISLHLIPARTKLLIQA